MWTRNVLIVAAAGALSAAPLFAQQKSAAAPRTTATAVRDTVQSHRVRHRSTSAPSTKADTVAKTVKTASRPTATTTHAKHTRKHAAKHAAKSSTTGVRTPSSAKP